MIEYIFFDPALRDAFVEYAQSQKVSCTLQDDALGFVVAVPEDIGEAVEDALEERYAALEREQARLLSEERGGLKQLAGFRFDLPDGQSRMVPLETETANRLLAVFSLEEVQHLFEAVARSALNPPEEHLCKVLAQGAAAKT